jgi:hypothetical protein
MADYKFKKGDRVRVVSPEDKHDRESYEIGEELTIDQDQSRCPYVLKEDGRRVCIGQNSVELIEPQYKKLSPKKGDKFRVVKRNRNIGVSSQKEEGEVFTVKAVSKDLSSGCPVTSTKNNAYQHTWFTTEYLEPVEEEECDCQNIHNGSTIKTDKDGNCECGRINTRRVKWPRLHVDVETSGTSYRQHDIEMRQRLCGEFVQEEIKQTLKQKAMVTIPKAIKKLLSKELNVFYKTSRIDSDLELSTKGRNEYVQALFNNKGDHAKAVAEMVEASQEEIDESKE